jgi:hypothetical protein
MLRQPKIGDEYSEIYPNLKGKLTAKHIIFYRVLEDQSTEKQESSTSVWI